MLSWVKFRLVELCYVELGILRFVGLCPVMLRRAMLCYDESDWGL